MEGAGRTVGALVATYDDTNRDTLEPIRVGVVDWPAGAQLPAVVPAALLKPAEGGAHDISRLRRILHKGRPPLHAVEASEAVNQRDVSAALKVLDRDMKRLEGAALRAKGERAGELFNLTGDLANARALLLKANQAHRGRTADDLRAEKGARVRTEIEGLREAIAASPLMQHHTPSVRRLIDLYKRPSKTLEERQMVSKRVATELLGMRPPQAPSKGGLYNIHNLVDEIGDEAGFGSTDDVITEARLLGDLERQVTALERQMPRRVTANKRRQNPPIPMYEKALERFLNRLKEETPNTAEYRRTQDELASLLLRAEQDEHVTAAEAQQLRERAGRAPRFGSVQHSIPPQKRRKADILSEKQLFSYYDYIFAERLNPASPQFLNTVKHIQVWWRNFAALHPNDYKSAAMEIVQRTWNSAELSYKRGLWLQDYPGATINFMGEFTPGKGQTRMFNPRRPSSHQSGFDASGNLFATPFHEQSKFERERERGQQAGFAFGADEHLGLTARQLTAEEESRINRGKMRPDVGQGRLFNPRQHPPLAAWLRS